MTSYLFYGCTCKGEFLLLRMNMRSMLNIDNIRNSDKYEQDLEVHKNRK